MDLAFQVHHIFFFVLQSSNIHKKLIQFKTHCSWSWSQQKQRKKIEKSSRAIQIRRFFNKLHRILSRTKYFFLTKNFSTLHEKSRYIKRLGWFFFTFYRAPWSSCFLKIFCCKYLQSCTWISHDFSLKTHCVLDTNKILLNAQRQISVLKTSKQKKLIS